MIPNVTSAPFTYKVIDGLGNTISNTPMNMVAGLVGVETIVKARESEFLDF